MSVSLREICKLFSLVNISFKQMTYDANIKRLHSTTVAFDSPMTAEGVTPHAVHVVPQN